MSEWVVVGTEVVERSNPNWSPTLSYGAVKKIAKVYKNGNFTVEGSTQQWDPRYRTHASKTGGGRYSTNRIDLVPLTDEVRADIEQAKQYRSAMSVIQAESDRLVLVIRSKEIEATIAEAKKIEAGK